MNASNSRTGRDEIEYTGREATDSADDDQTTYTCYGDVRGWCGCVHGTIEEAQECLWRDMDVCAQSIRGGYSDRCAYRCDDLSTTTGGAYYMRSGSRSPRIVAGRGGCLPE